MSYTPSESTPTSHASSNGKVQPRSRALKSQTKMSFSDPRSLNAPRWSSSSNSAPRYGPAIAPPGESAPSDVSFRASRLWDGSGTVVRHSKTRGINQGRRPARSPKSVFLRSSSGIMNFRSSGMTITCGAPSSTGEHLAENAKSSKQNN